ncbi:enoyl-CoA hydratase/isomerase family protein [Acidiphilium acidophilum]|uniref:enoyl-CoA hydratase/isomerase family protein n=1 Tax=Acidiphilium acidophilum TaxID=76588 RepID=UPI002E8E7069|nr:enoyl-CoA hydratase/isomerase family protein [Acidiphilium acidophilum]
MSTNDVLIRPVGSWGHITLNRPRALNALSYPMCCAIDDALATFASDPAIIGVLIDGEGERGFCAGGDIRALYDAARDGNVDAIATFFAREYRLNARIASFPKPYVALMDGITMGGGVGLSAHGSHRVVTERTTLAMPEVGIGFIPDVGASYLLGRAPDNLGIHIALTAMRLTAADALAIDLADDHVASASLDQLRRDLLEITHPGEIGALLRRYATPPGASALIAQTSWIAQCYAFESTADILKALRASGPAASEAASIITRQSPTSVRLALRALREARRLGSLEPCLALEYRIALRRVRSHDFIEGIRSAVVDKDRNPQWNPKGLSELDDAALDGYFASLGTEELRFN